MGVALWKCGGGEGERRWVLGKGEEWEEERDCVLICDEAEDL